VFSGTLYSTVLTVLTTNLTHCHSSHCSANNVSISGVYKFKAIIRLAKYLCTVVRNISGTSVWNLLYFTFPAPRFLSCLLAFWNSCVSLMLLRPFAPPSADLCHKNSKYSVQIFTLCALCGSLPAISSPKLLQRIYSQNYWGFLVCRLVPFMGTSFSSILKMPPRTISKTPPVYQTTWHLVQRDGNSNTKRHENLKQL
jgi:hypothetical protein